MNHTANATSSHYPALASLSAIGDGRSIALLEPSGILSWFCPSRFDAPPVFWSLMDSDHGGYLRMAPTGKNNTCTPRYVPHTAVLIYDWDTPTGTAHIEVCMAWPGDSKQQRILWQLDVLEGEVEFEFLLHPKPNFGREMGKFEMKGDSAYYTSETCQLLAQLPTSIGCSGGSARGTLQLKQGQSASASITIGGNRARALEPVALESVPALINKTKSAWRNWCSNLQLPAHFAEPIISSAVTLKLLIYEPTGAVVAAGTAGLPEAIGGMRNWDYRYTWFRDSGLVLDALYALGCNREAHRWAEWMQAVVDKHGLPLEVLYTVDGDPAPPEKSLPSIQGYRGSSPVREGNAAGSQFQLDVYGELLECVFICDSMNDDAMRRHWGHLREAADFIAEHWRKPDKGIWEVRQEPQHFVHSKVAAWAGLQRALWMQNRHNLECDSVKWRTEATAIHNEVLRFGVDHSRMQFTRAYDDPGPDASLLLLARYGFVNGEDPCFQNTVNTIQAELAADNNPYSGLLWRYRNDDGLPGEEGAFLICGFWLVDALSRGGRGTEAEKVFRNLLALRGSTGLLTEEVDPISKFQLGNIPQAFSHVGLISAAMQLAQAHNIAQNAH